MIFNQSARVFTLGCFLVIIIKQSITTSCIHAAVAQLVERLGDFFYSLGLPV